MKTDAELIKSVRKLFAKHVMSDRLTDQEILATLHGSNSLETALVNRLNKNRFTEEGTAAMPLNGDPIVQTLRRKLGVEK